MPVVRRGDADGVDARLEQERDGVVAVEAMEVGQCRRSALRPPSGSTGHGGQGDLHESKVAAEKAVANEGLEEREIRLFEDHAEADHASPNRFVGCWRHGEIL